MDSLRKDLVFALRSMRQNRAFTLAVLLSLALGIGADTAIFTAVDAVLLRPLPYPDADRLLVVGSVFKTRDAEIVGGASLPDVQAMRDGVGAFSGLAAAYTEESPPQPEIYQTFAQAFDSSGGVTLVLRSRRSPGALAPALRRAVAEIDPELAVADIRPLGDLVDTAIGQPRFQTALLGGFAGLALLLALLGVYGVMSYTASQRTREVGIRIALGATPRDIVRLMLARGLLWIGAGLVLGLGGALALSRVTSSLLFGVSSVDAVSYVVAPLLLAVTALVALLVPAWRASRTAPTVALKDG